MNEFFNESELIKLVIQGDRKAFAKLYTQYINNLYRYIYSISKSKEVSEEIVQDLFTRIWEHRDKLANVNQFKPYLYRSAKNTLLNHIKKSKAEAKLLIMTRPDTEESNERSDTQLIYNQYYEMAQEAINLLPEKRRQIVEMRTKDDLSLDEIAEKLNISKSVVKKQLYSGMDFVRKYLHKHGELAGCVAIYISLYMR